MKHITFKVVEDIVNPEGTTVAFSYRDVIERAIKTPMDIKMGMGMPVDELRKSIRLLDALEKGNELGMDLEDADFAYFKEKIQGVVRFNFTHRAFEQFFTDVLDLDKVKA